LLAGIALAPLAGQTFAAMSSSRTAQLARINAFIDRLASLTLVPPGFTVSIASSDGPILTRAVGKRDAQSGAPMTPDTPVYIASITKTYVGLMAVELNRRNVFSLNRTLAHYFPDARLPSPLDATQINFHKLLSHQSHISNEFLDFRTANAGEVPLSEYGRLLTIGTEYREPPFHYRNIGYLLYAAALEKETGKSWRDHLQTTIFDPLKLKRTSARPSVYPSAELARGHRRLADSWVSFAPKGDSTMHAAGGIMTTARDAATFIQVHLAGSVLPPTVYETARTPVVKYGPYKIDGVMADGYAYGWGLADYMGTRILLHTGNYTGFRSSLTLAPSLGLGVAVFVPTDHLGGAFAALLTQTVIDHFKDDPEAASRSEKRIATFDADTRSHLNDLTKKAEEAWKRVPLGWSPARAELESYTGRFNHPGYGQATVVNGGDHLRFRIGEFAARLTPALKDNFAGYEEIPHAIPERFGFQRGADGTLTSVQWAEWGSFQRIP
jgi:CubicO group peptidase (beta-lactamase class C family)